jgi:hypothetical protein
MHLLSVLPDEKGNNPLEKQWPPLLWRWEQERSQVPSVSHDKGNANWPHQNHAFSKAATIYPINSASIAIRIA